MSNNRHKGISRDLLSAHERNSRTNIHDNDLPSEPGEVLCPVCDIRAYHDLKTGLYVHPGRLFPCRFVEQAPKVHTIKGKSTVRHFQKELDLRAIAERIKAGHYEGSLTRIVRSELHDDT